MAGSAGPPEGEGACVVPARQAHALDAAPVEGTVGDDTRPMPEGRPGAAGRGGRCPGRSRRSRSRTMPSPKLSTAPRASARRIAACSICGRPVRSTSVEIRSVWRAGDATIARGRGGCAGAPAPRGSRSRRREELLVEPGGRRHDASWSTSASPSRVSRRTPCPWPPLEGFTRSRGAPPRARPRSSSPVVKRRLGGAQPPVARSMTAISRGTGRPAPRRSGRRAPSRR